MRQASKLVRSDAIFENLKYLFNPIRAARETFSEKTDADLQRTQYDEAMNA